jgi:endonuclease/exonuclease/phosphatase (EEP) superfamily protein YafD
MAKVLSMGTKLLAVEVKSSTWERPLMVIGSYHVNRDADLCRSIMTFMSNTETTPTLIAGDFNNDTRRIDELAQEWGFKHSKAKTRGNNRIDVIYANGDINQEMTFERGTSDHRILHANVSWTEQRSNDNERN